MPLTFIDCFSGAGGLSLGLKSAGFTPLAAFDMDPLSVATYNRNISQCAFVADVTQLSGTELMQRARVRPGDLDLLVGGPPCQGFSRQRRGPDSDSRNDLIFEFQRLVEELQPKSFLMENVSAITGGRGKAILSKLEMSLRSLGYELHRSVMDAAEHGVPQHRRRLFLVGFRQDILVNFAFPAPGNTFATVRNAIGDLPPPSPELAELHHTPDNISALNRIRISHVPEGGGRNDIPVGLRLACHAVSTEVAGHRGVYGRLSWDKPSGTITTKCNSFTRGRFAHPTENRNITMREAARLQSFPDTFIFEGSKVHVAHQVGNAVPPLLGQHLGFSIKKAFLASRESRQHNEDFQLAS